MREVCMNAWILAFYQVQEAGVDDTVIFYDAPVTTLVGPAFQTSALKLSLLFFFLVAKIQEENSGNDNFKSNFVC